MISFNVYGCGIQAQIESQYLDPGTYYLNISAPWFVATCYAFTLQAYPILPCPAVTCTPTVTESKPNGGCLVSPTEPSEHHYESRRSSRQRNGHHLDARH